MTAFYNFENNSFAQTCSYGIHKSGLFSKKKTKNGGDK